MSGPNGELQPTHNIPYNANIIAFNPNPKKNDLIYAIDEDGDEKKQIYRFDLTTGKSYLIIDDTFRSGSVIKYNPKGDKIVFTNVKRNQKDFDFYIMNPEDPSSKKMVLETEGIWILQNWAPNSKEVTIRKYISATDTELYILNLDTQELRSLALDTTETVTYTYSAWNNAGDKLYYTSNYKSEFTRLRVRDLKTNKDTVISSHIPWDISDITVSPDDNWLAFILNEDGVKRFRLYNTKSGEIKKIDKLPQGNIVNFKFSPQKDNTLGFNLRLPSDQSNIYSYNIEKDELIPWTSIEEISNYPDPEIIHYPTFDIDTITGKQREITAYFHRPSSSFKAPFPVIIFIHGGPARQWGIERYRTWPFYLNEGIAYLAPNVRGSTGYGKIFTNLDNGKLRENAVKDIGALLDWIEEHPELDANRVIVYGGSYGGYMSLACATHYSDRLLGIVDIVGISNFVSYLENNNEYRKDERRTEYGDERDPEMRAYLEKIAPINNIDKIKIPLLIAQGANDPRVPVTESVQMVEQLEANGKEIWYIEAANEGHFFKHPWNDTYLGIAEFEFINLLMEKGK